MFVCEFDKPGPSRRCPSMAAAITFEGSFSNSTIIPYP